MITRGILSHLWLLTMLQVLPATGFGSNTHECVIVLHGLGRTAYSMSRIENALENNHYLVWNESYPSTSDNIEELSTTAINKGLKFCSSNNAATIHFVTHSMGGILLRQHLQNNQIKNLGRVVMLAPPSQGSEVTDKLGKLKPYKWINGPAGNQLGTGAGSIPLLLKAPDFELGIIAGDRSINPILSLLIPGPDDGKVAVARVKPAACTDYIQLHVTHACMMWNPKVITQTQQFLKHGKFTQAK